MNELKNVFSALTFSSPLFILAGVPFILLFVFRTWGKKRYRTVGMGSLDFLQVVREERFRHIVRSIMLCLSVIVMLGALAGPRMISATQFAASKLIPQERYIWVIFDVSGSMGSRVNNGDIETSEGVSGPTKYSVARGVFRALVESHNDAAIGLILYSDEPFLAVYPGSDRALLAGGVLWEDIQTGSTPRLPLSPQLSKFSMGTDTGKALQLLARTIEKDGRRSSGDIAVIISDAIDNKREIAQAVEKLETQGVKTYMFIVYPDESGLEEMRQALGGERAANVFLATSTSEMISAYASLDREVQSLVISTQQRKYDVDMLSYVAVLLFVIFVGAIIFVHRFFLMLEPK